MRRDGTGSGFKPEQVLNWATTRTFVVALHDLQAAIDRYHYLDVHVTWWDGMRLVDVLSIDHCDAMELLRLVSRNSRIASKTVFVSATTRPFPCDAAMRWHKSMPRAPMLAGLVAHVAA